MIAPFSGYLFEESYGRKVAEGWSKAEADAKTWKDAYHSILRESDETLRELKALLDDSEARNKRYIKESKKKNTWNKISWLLIGGTLGGIIGHNR